MVLLEFNQQESFNNQPWSHCLTLGAITLAYEPENDHAISIKIKTTVIMSIDFFGYWSWWYQDEPFLSSKPELLISGRADSKKIEGWIPRWRIAMPRQAPAARREQGHWKLTRIMGCHFQDWILSFSSPASSVQDLLAHGPNKQGHCMQTRLLLGGSAAILRVGACK